MDYLKRFTRILLSNVELSISQQMVITYSEMAHSIVFAMILSIIKEYGEHYPLLDNALYCVTIAILYLSYTIVKVGYRYIRSVHRNRQLWLLFITAISVIVLSGMSYYHVEYRINTYVGHSKFYLQQEGEYAVFVDSLVERTTIDGKVYKKFSASLLGMHPFKDTATHMYAKTDGQLQITIEESHIPLTIGNLLIITGTPKPMYLVEERGTIDLRSRAIRNEVMGKLFGGTYRLMDKRDYKLYGIGKGMLYYAKILTIVGHIRQYIELVMGTYLGDTTKWLATSLVLGGYYSELGRDTLRQFAYTGIIHILSISGSHIALLFYMVYAICRLGRIKKKYAMVLGIIVSVSYCIVVGFSPPVVRSTIMGICMAIAYLCGRLYTAKQGLAITAIAFLLYDPLLILDVSFQLSFGATYGLLIFGMPLYHWMECLPSLLKAPIILCVSAQIIMVPFQLYYFHYISLASILAALLVAPLLDLAIVLLFIANLVNLILPIPLLWSGIEGLLNLALIINSYLANNSLFLIWIGVLPFTLSLLYFCMVGILYIFAVPLKVALQRFLTVIFSGILILLGIAYSGIYYKDQQIVHIVPLKQANVLLLTNPYSKRGIVYIETSKQILLQSIEYRIVNSVTSLGISPKNIVIKRFQSTDKNKELYVDDRLRIVVYNRQVGEKNIQLRDDKDSIIITSRSNIIHSQYIHNNRFRIVLTNSYSPLRDIEPDSEDIELWGYRYMEDTIF